MNFNPNPFFGQTSEGAHTLIIKQKKRKEKKKTRKNNNKKENSVPHPGTAVAQTRSAAAGIPQPAVRCARLRGTAPAAAAEPGQPGSSTGVPGEPAPPLPSLCDLPRLLVRTSVAGKGTSVTKTRNGCFSK